MNLRQRLSNWLSRRLDTISRQLTAQSLDASQDSPRDDVYVFVAINGAGLGHLTRCLAIARRLEEQKPSARIVFFTTSLGLVIVHRFGYPCFHIPPFAQLDHDKVDSNRWNSLFANHLREIVSLYHPKAVIFDGTYAYGGLQTVINERPDIPFMWVRRAGTSSKHQDAIASQSKMFGAIVVPGDVEAQKSTAMVGDVLTSAPVVLLQPHELLTREQARDALALDYASKVAYVQLGAGNINELSALEKQVLNTLQEFQDLVVVLSISPIALTSSTSNHGIRNISSYPNAQFFYAFDFAILAAGYNSVNECLAYGLPALFIPNTNTKSDDQLSRAQNASWHDGWYTWDGVSTDELRLRIVELIQRSGPGAIPASNFNGATEIANIALSL